MASLAFKAALFWENIFQIHVKSQEDISMVEDMGIAIPLSAHSLVAVHLTKV